MRSEFQLDEPRNGNSRLGWMAFAFLLTFMGGNGLSYLIFGLNTVKRSDFDRSILDVQTQLSVIDAHQTQQDNTIADLKGQLKAEHMLQP